MIYLGGNELLGINLGANEISGVYCGSELIYPTTVTGFSVSPTEINVGSASGSTTIRIASTETWNIMPTESWISLSQSYGDSGRTTVTIDYSEYTGTTSRYAEIVVNSGPDRIIVELNQSVCNPLVIANNIDNTNNDGYQGPQNFYVFDTGVTVIDSCNYDFTGIESITCRPDSFYLDGVPNAMLGNGQGESACALPTLESFEADCSTVTWINFPFGADWAGGPNLTAITLNNTDNVTTFANFAYWLPALEYLKLGDLSSVNNFKGDTELRIFGPDNTALTTFEIDAWPDKDLSDIGLNYCTALTQTSLVNILNALPETTWPRSIQIGSTNMNKLSSAEIAIATDKGWNVY